MYIYSHNPRSAGAKALKKELGCKMIRHTNSRFIGAPYKTVINWGCSSLPGQVMKCRVINPPGVVSTVSNKLDFFKLTKGLGITPLFTTSIDEAKDWLKDGHTVVCRTILRGSGGAGIVIANTVEQLVDAPLYVQYKKKKDEYRVHIYRGKVFDTQKKALKLDLDVDPDWQVRNHKNGFIYKRANLDVPDCVSDVALAVMAHFNELNFGAVDVIYNEHEKKAYALEINTAPGLEGQTVKSYAEMFKEIM